MYEYILNIIFFLELSGPILTIKAKCMFGSMFWGVRIDFDPLKLILPIFYDI